MRKLILNGRDVILYQITSWQQHSIPNNDESVRFLLNKFTEHLRDNEELKPVLVHSSFGVGRAGTFLVLAKMILEAEREYVSIFETVLDLRMQRRFLVDNAKQYLYVLKYANRYIK
ncbi:hypothetical protein ACOME3_001538 [Neoechinorhynchus agilis]